MKSKLLKFSKKKTTKLSTDKAININVQCSIVHTGKVLSISEIENNRSSKYLFLSFSF